MAVRSVPRSHIAALCAVVLAGLGLRCWGLTWGLYNADVSRRPHPDEWPVYWLSHWFAASHTLNPCPQPLRQCFFDWGSVFPYGAYTLHALVAPVLALLPPSTFGPHADPAFVQSVLAGRLLSVAASTLTILLVYILARRSYGTGAGLAAALIAALSGLPIQLAHFATPDATTAFLMCASLLAMSEAMRAPSIGWFAASGALVGLSVGTEYQMALLAVPLVAAWLFGVREHRVWLAAAVAAACVTAIASNPYALVDLNAFVAASEHAIRIRTVDSGAQYQGRWAPYDPAWLYVVRYPLGYGVGFAFTGIMVAGALWACYKRQKVDLLLLWWILPYLLLVTLTPARFMRYSAPLIPPLSVLAGRAIVDWYGARRGFPRTALALTAALAVAYTGVYDAAYAGLFSSTDPRVDIVDWMTHHIASGAQVAFDELPNGLVNLPYFAGAAGYRPCFSQFQRSRLDVAAAYMVVDEYDREDHARVSDAQMLRYESALHSSRAYAVVKSVHNVPTFLGLRFPIDGSPHDWRYPSHVITVYRHELGPQASDRYCYSSVRQAEGALYPLGAQG